MLDTKKTQIQNEALEAWLNADSCGTIELSTGHGKTFIAFKAILSLPIGSNILFLSETTLRENNVRKDAEDFKKHYGFNPLDGYNITFVCYQTAYKHCYENKDIDLVIMDEIHDMLTPKYFNFAKNNLIGKNIKCMGLSATINKKTKFIIDDKEETKKTLLDKFCPIVYSYVLNDALENNTTRELEFIVIEHELDGITKNIQAGKKGAYFLQTELSKYAYLNKNVKTSFYKDIKDPKKKEVYITAQASARARFLYSLPSKVEACKELLSFLQEKTLFIGLDSKTILSICPTSIVDENKNHVKHLEDFKLGKTLLTGSNKMLKQGENIPGLVNLVLLAYYSKSKDFEQYVGRNSRGKDLGKVFIFLIKNTQEEVWFQSMTEGLNIEFKRFSNVKNYIKYVKSNNN